MLAPRLPIRTWLLPSCLALSLATGCGDDHAADGSIASFDQSSCDTSFEARASRVGSAGQARLSYACAADLCSASAPFAAGTTQLVTVDVPAAMAESLTIVSSDDSVMRTKSVRTVLDPCLDQTRAYVSLEARKAGPVSLRVTANGLDDALALQVSAPASISLRASLLREFDFSPHAEAEALTGEPLLVLPSLLGADGEPLLGLPALTWRVADASLAAVRTEPNSEDESFIRDWADASAVFIDAKRPGLTRVHVETADGTTGSLAIRIIDAAKTTP